MTMRSMRCRVAVDIHGWIFAMMGGDLVFFLKFETPFWPLTD